MTRSIRNPAIRTIATVSCVLLLPYASSLALAQSLGQIPPQAASQGAPPQLLAPDQLDDLVAPIALYPDPLLSQLLAASTYPLEIVEAQQWLQQNRNLQGRQLIDAARQQNWDPSVQVLVAFPDVMALFGSDIRWTTDLGNAFLAQQADVMNAIQRLRAQASNSGRLATTPQQIVTTETQNEQSAIQIQPADPQVMYPPVYDPANVWGPPVSGAYPALSYAQGGDGSGFGNGINLGGLLSGALGWGGWGWALNWFTHTLSLVGLFFNSLGSLAGGMNSTSGFNSAGGFGAPAVWVHNPAHRLGVPYSNGVLTARYYGAGSGAGRMASDGWRRPGGASFAAAPSSSAVRPASDGWRRFGGGNPAYNPSSSAAMRGSQPANRMAESYNRAAAPAYRPSYASNSGGSPQNYRSYSSAMPQRMEESYNRATAPAYRPGYASNAGGSPQNYRSYSAAMPQRMASSFRGAAPAARTPAAVSPYAAPRTSSQQRFSSRASAPPQHFSAPRSSSSHFSAPHFSAPRGSSRSSGPRHSGGGHSSKGSRKH